MELHEGGTGVVQSPRNHWRVSSVADAYESRRFNHLKGRFYRWREERAIHLALRGLPAGSRVLDAACGTGRITALLRGHAFHVTGCDLSSAMLQIARAKLNGLDEVQLVQCDAERLPHSDKSFDAVTCIGLLMHFDADARVRILRELARVSRDRIIIQYGCAGAFLRVKARMTGRMPGNVAHPVSEAVMRTDLERSQLTERERFWILRPFSSSVVVWLTG